jgi:endonuclease/exonuclease/phosphatase family metal-dependent hydrolase
MLLATYNIQYGTGKDGRVDLPRIVGELREADVVALQEVDCFFPRSGDADQAEAIARLLADHHWVYGAGVDVDAGFRDAGGRLVNRRRRFGNMLLSRFPILSSRNHLLPKHGLVRQKALQRSALEGVVALPGGPVRVFSVHLGHAAAPERMRQIGRLQAILADSPAEGGVISGLEVEPEWLAGQPPPPMPRPAVLMGDFNLTPDSAEYDALCGPLDPRYGRLGTLSGLADAWIAAGNAADPGFTGTQDGTPVRIDYVLLTADLAGGLRRAWVDATAEGSDHQPLFAEVAL